jgi:hypothetical protein
VGRGPIARRAPAPTRSTRRSTVARRPGRPQQHDFGAWYSRERRSGKTGKGNKRLRATLTEAASAASRTKHSYIHAQYQRLRGRRGHSKAVTAVGHSILTAAWHMLQTGELYNDPGSDYFTRQNPDRITRRLVRPTARSTRTHRHTAIPEAPCNGDFGTAEVFEAVSSPLPMLDLDSMAQSSALLLRRERSSAVSAGSRPKRARDQRRPRLLLAQAKRAAAPCL